MAVGIGIYPAGARVSHDLDHALEHVRARIQIYARITKEDGIGFRVDDSSRVHASYWLAIVTCGYGMPSGMPHLGLIQIDEFAIHRRFLR